MVHQICRITLHCDLVRSLQLCWEAQVRVSKGSPNSDSHLIKMFVGNENPSMPCFMKYMGPSPYLVIFGCKYLPISPNHNLSQRDDKNHTQNRFPGLVLIFKIHAPFLTCTCRPQSPFEDKIEIKGLLVCS